MIKTTNERGASIVEVLAVLAVIGCISVGMLKGISSVFGTVKITQAQNQVDRVVEAMRENFSSYLPTTTPTPTALAKLGVYKKEEVQGDKAYNVYGSEMAIKVFNEDNPYFTFTYKDLESKLCAKLLQGNWGNDTSSGLRAIVISGSTSSVFDWDKSNTSTKMLPPSLKDSLDVCETEDSDLITIIWSYYL